MIDSMTGYKERIQAYYSKHNFNGKLLFTVEDRKKKKSDHESATNVGAQNKEKKKKTDHVYDV